jgi:hypothetical protein
MLNLLMRQDPVFCIEICHFLSLTPPSSSRDCCFNWTREKQVEFQFYLIDLNETGIVVASTLVPMPFVDADSLDETRS